MLRQGVALLLPSMLIVVSACSVGAEDVSPVGSETTAEATARLDDVNMELRKLTDSLMTSAGEDELDIKPSSAIVLDGGIETESGAAFLRFDERDLLFRILRADFSADPAFEGIWASGFGWRTEACGYEFLIAELGETWRVTALLPGSDHVELTVNISPTINRLVSPDPALLLLLIGHMVRLHDDSGDRIFDCTVEDFGIEA